MPRYGGIDFVNIALVLLALASWAVLLGGAASLQKDADTITGLLNQMSATLTYGDLFPLSKPRNFISYEWFKAVLQVLTLLFVLGVLATGQMIRFRVAVVGLLAVNAVLWCDACQTFYYLRTQVDAAEAVTGSSIAMRVRTWWAGCMLAAAFDLLLIITCGITPVSTYDEPARRNGHRDTFPDENKTTGNTI